MPQRLNRPALRGKHGCDRREKGGDSHGGNVQARWMVPSDPLFRILAWPDPAAYRPETTEWTPMSSTTTKMTIALSPETAGFLREIVASGAFVTEGAAVEEALRAWRDRLGVDTYSVEDLRTLADEGLASGISDRTTMADVKAEARRRLVLRTR